jgi:outer membrane protein
MKILFKPLIAALAFSASAFVGLAQAPKVAIVDMARLFDNHYKTLEKNAVFQSEQDKVKEEINRLNGEGLALQEQAQGIAEQLNNPVLSDDKKAQIQQEARAKVDELRRKQEEMNALLANSSESLKKRIMNFRSLLMDEISKVAVEVAKRKGVTLLMDKSGPSLLGVPAVLYYEPGFEITEDVLTEINKDKPAGAPAAAAGSTEAPAVSFPAAGN